MEITAPAPIETSEPTPDVESQTPKENVSERFAFLAKKEAGIVRQRQELKSQLAALEAQKAELEKLRSEVDGFKSRRGSYKSNPLSLLEDHGMTYKELTDYILNNNTVTPESQIKSLQDKIEQVEKQRLLDLEDAKRRELEQQKNHETQVIADFKNEINRFIKAKSETFELTALYDSGDLVYDTVEEYFNKTNKVLSIPEACELVEKYLEQQVEKTLKTKKISTKLSSKPVQPTIDKPSPSAPRRTLSNTEYTSSTPSVVSPKVDNDRMARALAALDL